MKMFLKIIKYRFISSLKHPATMVCLLLALFSSIFAGIYAHNNQNDLSLYPIAIVNEDGGEYSVKFIESIAGNEQLNVVFLSREKAIRQVSTGRIDGAFVLLDGFSEKIEGNDFESIVEFVSPAVTTSAYPVSEIVASEIVDIWLMQLVESTLIELYDELGDDADLEFYAVIDRIDTDYKTEDIIKIEFVGQRKALNADKDIMPIDRSVGIYAAFLIFAVMLSGEWIFNIKKRGLQSRFISSNINLSVVCLASQLASVFLAMLFFIPFIVVFAVFLSISTQAIFYMAIGMFLYLLCTCSMAFIVSMFADNLAQLVVVGTSVSIINILLSSLAMPLPNWASAASSIGKILPGTYLIGCYRETNQFTGLIVVTLGWVFIGYLCTLYLRKRAKV